jgi:hypothetical protein
MADIGYRAQLPNSVVLRRTQFAPGVGSAIGQGLAQLGKTVLQVRYADQQTDERIAESQTRIAQIEQQRARGQAVADGMGRLAQAKIDTDAEVQALQDASEPGAPGYAAQAEAVYRKNWQAFLDTLPADPEVQQQFAQSGATWIAAGVTGARDWERTQRVKNMGDSFESSLNTDASALYSKPDPEALKTKLGEYASAIDLQLLPGTDKARLKDMARAKLTGSTFDGMIVAHAYDAVEAALNTGAFDWMGPDVKDRYLQQVAAGRDVQARQAEAEAHDAKKTAVGDLQSLQVDLENGNPPSVSTINAALAKARAAGVDEKDLKEFAYLADSSVRAQNAQGMTTGAISGDLAKLRTKRAAGQASEADVRQIAAYEAELKGRDEKAGGGIKQLAQAGAQGQAAAATQLAGMDPDRRWAAAREAGDERLAVYANFTPKGRLFAAQGRELRNARPDDFVPPKTPGGGGKDEARALFRQAIGERLTDELGGSFDDVFEASLDAMAGMARKWDPANFKLAIQYAFGATRRSNGQLQGGIGLVRGRKIELPDRLTAAEFDAKLARGNFSAARYANGAVASKIDILGHFTPVPVSGTRGAAVHYRFMDAQGHLLMRDDGKGLVPFEGYF